MGYVLEYNENGARRRKQYPGYYEFIVAKKRLLASGVEVNSFATGNDYLGGGKKNINLNAYERKKINDWIDMATRVHEKRREEKRSYSLKYKGIKK